MSEITLSDETNAAVTESVRILANGFSVGASVLAERVIRIRALTIQPSTDAFAYATPADQKLAGKRSRNEVAAAIEAVGGTVGYSRSNVYLCAEIGEILAGMGKLPRSINPTDNLAAMVAAFVAENDGDTGVKALWIEAANQTAAYKAIAAAKAKKDRSADQKAADKAAADAEKADAEAKATAANPLTMPIESLTAETGAIALRAVDAEIARLTAEVKAVKARKAEILAAIKAASETAEVPAELVAA